MIKNVTLFGCFLFTGFSFCTPAYAAATSKLITLNASIVSITSNTFYSIFIAIVIAFFLLGLIIGYLINPHRKLRKSKEKALLEVTKNKQEEPNDLGQDMTGYGSGQTRGSNTRDSRYQYYNNYRNNPNPPRR